MNIDLGTLTLIASVLTAITVIVTTSKKWGGAIAKAIVKIGFAQLSGEDLARNKAMQAGHSARQEIMEKLDSIQQVLNDDMRVTLKLELKSLYKDFPDRVDVIEKTYKRYHDLGGNSYITSLHEAWKEKYESKIIDKTLNKGGK